MSAYLTPGKPGPILAGYSTCWYCDEVVVDARQYTIQLDGETLPVAVCRKRRCREAARDGRVMRSDD